jgi:hypothetical protein
VNYNVEVNVLDSFSVNDKWGEHFFFFDKYKWGEHREVDDDGLVLWLLYVGKF